MDIMSKKYWHVCPQNFKYLSWLSYITTEIAAITIKMHVKGQINDYVLCVLMDHKYF